jgi:hypothetical protein
MEVGRDRTSEEAEKKPRVKVSIVEAKNGTQERILKLSTRSSHKIGCWNHR